LTLIPFQDDHDLVLAARINFEGGRKGRRLRLSFSRMGGPPHRAIKKIGNAADRGDVEKHDQGRRGCRPSHSAIFRTAIVRAPWTRLRALRSAKVGDPVLPRGRH